MKTTRTTKATGNKKRKYIIFQRELAMSLLVLTLLFAAMMVLTVIMLDRRYKEVSEHSGAIQIRTMVMQAVHELKSDAPVDAKTGDIYFPEARLFIPRPHEVVNLRYNHSRDGTTNEGMATLSLSTESLGTNKLMSAKSVDELFAAVPGFQACQRGVTLSLEQLTTNQLERELKNTIYMPSKKPLYIYVEPACSDHQGLDKIYTVINNIRQY